jgi:hypothetical protein
MDNKEYNQLVRQYQKPVSGHYRDRIFEEDVILNKESCFRLCRHQTTLQLQDIIIPKHQDSFQQGACGSGINTVFFWPVGKSHVGHLVSQKAPPWLLNSMKVARVHDTAL